MEMFKGVIDTRKNKTKHFQQVSKSQQKMKIEVAQFVEHEVIL